MFFYSRPAAKQEHKTKRSRWCFREQSTNHLLIPHVWLSSQTQQVTFMVKTFHQQITKSLCDTRFLQGLNYIKLSNTYVTLLVRKKFWNAVAYVPQSSPYYMRGIFQTTSLCTSWNDVTLLKSSGMFKVKFLQTLVTDTLSRISFSCLQGYFPLFLKKIELYSFKLIYSAVSKFSVFNTVKLLSRRTLLVASQSKQNIQKSRSLTYLQPMRTFAMCQSPCRQRDQLLKTNLSLSNGWIVQRCRRQVFAQLRWQRSFSLHFLWCLHLVHLQWQSPELFPNWVFHLKNTGTIQNRSQKVVNRGALRLYGGLYVRAGGAWHSNLTKIPLIYSVSYFNVGGLELCLGGLSPPKAPRGDGTGTII